MSVLLHQGFVQNAFLAGTIIAIVAAIVGYFVVLRTLAFASESLSHLGFAGAIGAALFGLSSLVGAFIFTLLGSVGIGILGERARGRDIETGMVLSFALGLGVLFLGLYASGANANATVAVLFGSILSVSRQTMLEIALAAVLVLVLLTLLFRPLLFASIDPEVAQARGIPVRLLAVAFLLLLAITVATSIQVVGALLIFALLLAPAATAQLWTRRPLVTVGLSVMLSLLFTWGGLLLAFAKMQHQVPVSFSISALAALSYGLSLLLRRYVFPNHEVLRNEPEVGPYMSKR